MAQRPEAPPRIQRQFVPSEHPLSAHRLKLAEAHRLDLTVGHRLDLTAGHRLDSTAENEVRLPAGFIGLKSSRQGSPCFRRQNKLKIVFLILGPGAPDPKTRRRGPLKGRHEELGPRGALM